MIFLPEAYRDRLQTLLGDEFEKMLSCYSQKPFRGIRRNPLKCSEKVLMEALPCAIAPTPFSAHSYTVPQDIRLGNHPLHHAGAFYVQEPSAASAVTVLAPCAGERVLDLCAAPGGKSTQIAGLLDGKGVLWSNEVVKSRANILLSNLERLGVRNAVVSSCHPQVLCQALSNYFDKVLVDAPCSGEGMFRREEQAVKAWSEEHAAACAVRQGAILDSAACALRAGGILVYSTCTFSEEENEAVVRAFLERHPEFRLTDCGVPFGRPGFLEGTRRIFPMDGGEGHFVAKLQKEEGEQGRVQPYPYLRAGKEARDFCQRIYTAIPSGCLEWIGDQLLLLPEELPLLRGLGVLRAGVLLGHAKKGRIEPAHALFQAVARDELQLVLNLSHDSEKLAAFLRGEELDAPAGFQGWTGVAVDGVMTGFGKCAGGRLKNHYPKGLRSKAAGL